MAEEEAAVDFPWAASWPEIVDARLRVVFARVPRARFVAEDLRPFAAQDAPLPIGEGQTISQPFIVAWMTQALALQPGEKILEIGTGSGYQTAILCELTRQAGAVPGQNVYSVERFAGLAQAAERALTELGYAPHLRLGDGAAGWPEEAPFAAILVTAAAAYLPRPLWDQLAEGGRMIIPVGATPEEQRLWLFQKQGGVLVKHHLGAVRFVPFISPLLTNPAMRVEF
jgi:protein-L-isoaspartate(D-aspartate) O-methyltransferase